MAVYDPIAKNYKQVRENLAYKYVETYTYLNKLGNLSGKSILDLGCGEGIFSRNFKQQGAAQVVGVDISSKMIELAKEEEARTPLGIEYIVGDMRDLGKIGSFDLVGAAFSLNHAQTKEELRAMCQTIYDNLKPDCRFVCLNNNLDQPIESYERVTKYGCTKNPLSSLEEGTPISVYVFEVNGEKISIDDYYLSKEIYEWAFREVGFKEINWYKPMVSPEGIREFGEDFWKDLLENPSMSLIECQK